MISLADLTSEHIQANFAEYIPSSNKSENNGVSFEQLLNANENKPYNQEEICEKEVDLQDKKVECDADFEEAEIEVEVSEEQSNENVVAMSSFNQNVKGNKTKKDDFLQALSSLNNVVKKNVAFEDKKITALSALATSKTEKIKISVKNLEPKAKTKAIAVLKDLKAGKITNEIAMVSLADIVKESKLGQSIKSDKKRIGKNVKITAKSVKTTKNENMLTNSEKRISQNDMLALNKTQNISETKQTKTNNTNNTEVSRKDEQKTKVKTTKTDATVSVSSQDISGDRPLQQFTTELNLKTEDFKSVANGKSDIKAVLSDNKQTIFNNLVDNTKFIQTQNLTKFSMVMRPENVGRMDFQLSIKDGKIGGKIILQTQEAADFFKANIEEITAVFRKANVELSSLDVSLAGQNFSQQNGQFAQNSQGQGFSNDMMQTMRVSAHYSNRALSAFESNTTVASNGNYTGINLLI